MSFKVENSDLSCLHTVFPSFDFADHERRSILQNMGTFDVQAAPGSGKTTLLTAKLVILASKWNLDKRGVCVLSHTNVAREQVEKGVEASGAGKRILCYPHFLGTIQVFVHTFLALPFLHSCGVSPCVIDDDSFGDQAVRLARKDGTLYFWIEKAGERAENVIRTLRYRGKDLTLDCAGGQLPGTKSKSLGSLRRLKHELTESGVFRYDDMFAFGECLLHRHPGVAVALSHRFPLVLLDEMQDTSSLQEDLLRRAFHATVVVQRLGDVNQRILGDLRDDQVVTFPRTGFLALSTSKRFGQPIADVANRLRLVDPEIVGEGPRPAVAPTLLLYSDKTIKDVIPAFGSLVASHLGARELAQGLVKAVCARKQGESRKGLGRHIADYWPAFDPSALRHPAACRYLIDVLRSARQGREYVRTLQKPAEAVRTGLLAVLRTTGRDGIRAARKWPELLELVGGHAPHVSLLNGIVRSLILADSVADSAADWEQSVSELYCSLKPFAGCTEEAFRTSEYLSYRDGPTLPGQGRGQCLACNRHRVNEDSKVFDIAICTIAASKGETHLATLVLESFWHSSFDVASAVSYLCGRLRATSVDKPVVQQQLRNLFVATTRPTRLLCLAMHRSRLKDADAAQLASLGMILQDC